MTKSHIHTYIYRFVICILLIISGIGAFAAKAHAANDATKGTREKYGLLIYDYPTPEKEGYQFAGWYTAAKGGTKIDPAKWTTPLAAKTDYYAHWTPNSYKLTVNITNNRNKSQTNNNGSDVNAIKDVTITATRKGSSDTRTYTIANGGTCYLKFDDEVTVKANMTDSYTQGDWFYPTSTVRYKARHNISFGSWKLTPASNYPAKPALANASSSTTTFKWNCTNSIVLSCSGTDTTSQTEHMGKLTVNVTNNRNKTQTGNKGDNVDAIKNVTVTAVRKNNTDKRTYTLANGEYVFLNYEDVVSVKANMNAGYTESSWTNGSDTSKYKVKHDIAFNSWQLSPLSTSPAKPTLANAAASSTSFTWGCKEGIVLKCTGTDTTSQTENMAKLTINITNNRDKSQTGNKGDNVNAIDKVTVTAVRSNNTDRRTYTLANGESVFLKYEDVVTVQANMNTGYTESSWTIGSATSKYKVKHDIAFNAWAMTLISGTPAQPRLANASASTTSFTWSCTEGIVLKCTGTDTTSQTENMGKLTVNITNNRDKSQTGNNGADCDAIQNVTVTAIRSDNTDSRTYTLENGESVFLNYDDVVTVQANMHESYTEGDWINTSSTSRYKIGHNITFDGWELNPLSTTPARPSMANAANSSASFTWKCKEGIVLNCSGTDTTSQANKQTYHESTYTYFRITNSFLSSTPQPAKLERGETKTWRWYAADWECYYDGDVLTVYGGVHVDHERTIRVEWGPSEDGPWYVPNDPNNNDWYYTGKAGKITIKTHALGNGGWY